jgi:hypothetical protein
MVDAIKILGDLKGKVLDALHFDLLRQAYELQSQNIEQLKENNAVLRERSDLLKDKSEALLEEITRLKAKVADLEARVPGDARKYEPKGLALKILQSYKKTDSSSLEDRFLLRSISCGRVELEVALRELEDEDFLRAVSHQILRLGGEDDWGGTTYALSEEGKKLVLILPRP